jgi:hypothetical protein
VQFAKERLELQAKIDDVKELDMCMKVKQLGMKMQKQVNVVFQPFLNFMDFFQPTKTHNMVALMLDLKFKDLSLVGDYVEHVFAIEIATTFDINFLLPTFKIMYQSCMDA